MEKKIIAIICVLMLVSLLFAGCEEEQKIIDSDGDGVADGNDDFPNDKAISKDSDGDGYPDEYNKGYDENDTDIPLDMFPQDASEYKDSDGDGYGNSKDAFPYDPEIHRIINVEEKTIKLEPGKEKTVEFETKQDQKYAVIYWELEPFSDETGDTIAFRFKTGTGWQTKKHRGKTKQVKEKIRDYNYGEWAIWIKHDTIVTGYDKDIVVSYRIYILE